MLFFLCFSPTIKFQDGSPVDPLFEPPADPPFGLDLSKIIFIVISASLIKESPVIYLVCISQDFHFLLQDPWTLELILKPREGSRIIDFDTFLKGFRRVLEGVLKGF